MAELIPVEKARMGEWRDVPTGRLRTTYFLESPRGTDLPQCFRVENTPHRLLESHFHATDQFQVFTAGSGTMGRHPVAPYAVHFARAYTPYGPLRAGPEGLAWLSIRARHDEGAQYMPASREQLMAVENRHPWQFTAAWSFDALPADASFHPLPGIHDDRGLGAFAVRVASGAGLVLPDASCTGGQFLIAVRGGVKQADGDTRSLATMLVKPGEPAAALVAGEQGLDALVLNFPRAELQDKDSQRACSSAAEAEKVWLCAPCGFVYDEASGLPDEGIAPGTPLSALPAEWRCPDCGAPREEFRENEF